MSDTTYDGMIKSRMGQRVQVRMHRTEDAGRSGVEHSNVEGVEFLTHDGNSFFVYFDGKGGLTISIENLTRTVSVEPGVMGTLHVKSRKNY